MKRNIIFTILLVTVFILGASAQNPEEDLDELYYGQIFQVDNLLYSNLSFICQTGNENSIITLQ